LLDGLGTATAYESFREGLGTAGVGSPLKGSQRTLKPSNKYHILARLSTSRR
jgi:hypothetical protein